jgi:uncharacterized membrane protein
MVNSKKFLCVFLGGIFLLAACIIGTCISSISMYNDLDHIQNRVLIIPYILSYIIVVTGLIGMFYKNNDK